jgi:hypothetical protein
LRAQSTHTREAEATKTGLAFDGSPSPAPPESGSDEGCAPPKKNAQPAPFPQERGEISDAIDVEDPALLASSARFDPRAFGKMLRHSISKRQKPIGTH